MSSSPRRRGSSQSQGAPDRLRIQILEARSLPSADRNGLSDPFCWVLLNNTQKRDTPVIYKTLNPVWDKQVFDYKLEDPRMDVVTVVVWDKDPIGKDFLGECLIPVSCVAYKSAPVSLWVPLRPKATSLERRGKKAHASLSVQATSPTFLGELHVELTFMAASNAPSMPTDSNQTKSEERDMLTKSAISTFRNQAEMLQGDSSAWEIPRADLEVGELVAEGVNGFVYAGSYRGQPVAIKVLKQALDPVQMKDFTMEFQMLSRLKSPWAVLFYGSCINEQSGKLSMVFEFCTNGSLTDYMKRNDVRFDWELFFKFAIQMCSGIASLHNWVPAIVHRDIKSLNFLVDSFDNIKVADLGLARTQEDTNDETLKSLRGTYHYTPPEAYGKEQTYDAKSDVYSLAVCLWELTTRTLTGAYQMPYADSGFKFDFQIIIAVSKEGLRPPIPPNTPQLLRELIEKCWDTDRQNRLDSETLVQALQKLRKLYQGAKEEWDQLLPQENE